MGGGRRDAQALLHDYSEIKVSLGSFIVRLHRSTPPVDQTVQRTSSCTAFRSFSVRRWGAAVDNRMGTESSLGFACSDESSALARCSIPIGVVGYAIGLSALSMGIPMLSYHKHRSQSQLPSPRIESVAPWLQLGPKLVPSDPFIAFSYDGTMTNVPGPGDDVTEAVKCLAPQSICGCGYESPIEAMMQALAPTGRWNDPAQTTRPFLRDDAILGVVLMSDEADCSVLMPSGLQYFTDDDTYWPIEPASGSKVDSLDTIPSGTTGYPQRLSTIAWNPWVSARPKMATYGRSTAPPTGPTASMTRVARSTPSVDWINPIPMPI